MIAIRYNRADFLTTRMPLGPGTRLGPYEIVSPLGSGGMGEVYKAKDTRLDRTVAIKVLPSHVSGDPALRERFEREARTIGALNHPHICTLYDVGHQEDTDFLVLEYLEGQTLAERLTKGALPLDQTLQIAIQIADALDKAHRVGIVHRDLKPGNIMLTKSGAKLLDFGLAKVTPAVVAASGLSMAPTGASPVTMQGTILGTLQYMAPEQIEGQEADARTDIFAFGCVLYEMLTGRKAFEGKTQATLIAAILEREPPVVSSLQPMTPAALEHVVQRCLAKSPDDRWQSASDVMRELQWARSATLHPSLPMTTREDRLGLRRQRFAWTVLSVAAVAIAILGTWYLAHRSNEPLVTQLDVTSPPTADAFSFAVAPDGRHLVFVANGEKGSQLWLRSLDQAKAQSVDGTAGATFPFWSPDSRDIGFFADGKLKRLSIQGGGPRVLADAATARGGTWNQDGVIVFGQASPGALMRVRATGGVPVAVTQIAKGQNNHRWPQFLPDQKRILFFVQSPDPQIRGIYVASLEGGTPTRVVESETAGIYAAGYLLRVVQGSLLAQRLSLSGLSLTGDPIALAQDVGTDDGLYRSAFSASSSGVVAHRTAVGFRRQLVWVDRAGKSLGTVGGIDEGSVAGPELAPSGDRVAVARTVQGNTDIWLIDLRRGVESRFTFDPGIEDNAVWSPDGGRMAFRSLQAGSPEIFEKPVDGSTSERTMMASPGYSVPHDWSGDGRVLLYSTLDVQTQSDIWALPLTGDRKPIRVVQSRFDDVQEQFSPDGRLIAYASNESGRYEVYVLPYPPGGGKWQVSAAGGMYPRWRRDGNELYYVDPDNRLIAVPISVVAGSRQVNAGVPTPLFSTNLAAGANIFAAGVNSRAQYAVAADGRFLMNIAADDAVTSPITIVLNWTAALKK
jgi:eukaryotic-like serine/threonine-protein kinase